MGNLSEKQLFIILIAVALLVAAAFSGLGVMDYLSIQEKKEKTQLVKDEARKFGNKASRVTKLNEDLQVLRDTDKENRKALPAERFDNALLEGIFAQSLSPRHKVNVVSFEFIGDQAASRPGASADPWTSFDIKMKVEGPFFSLLMFVNRLEHYPRLLSVRRGRFGVKTGVSSRKTDEEPQDAKMGPQMTLDLDIQAYVARQTAPPPARPAQPATGKPGSQPPGAPAAPAAAPKPEEVGGQVYTSYVEKYVIENIETRRNPFEIWLERKKIEEAGPVGPKVPETDEKLDQRILDWEVRIKELNQIVSQGGNEKDSYVKYKTLFKEMKDAVMTGDRDVRKSDLLAQLTSLESDIKGNFETFLKSSASDTHKSMQQLWLINGFQQILVLFEDLLEDLYIWEPPIPTRAFIDFQNCQKVYLQVLDNFVEVEGEFDQVIKEIEILNKSIPEKWKRDSFLVELLARTGEIREKAQALMEFYKFDILVSGLLWMPFSEKRLAIVNDSAVLEGGDVPLKKGMSAPLPAGQEAPVQLESVGKEQYVFFKYKGLRIKYAIGEAGRKRKP